MASAAIKLALLGEHLSDILNDDERTLVELGIQAQHLLTSQTFSNAVNTLSEQLTNAILSTFMDETQKRERLYMMHSCLNELVGILKSRVAAKDNIEARLNDDTDNEG